MKVLISPSSFGQCGLEPISLLEKHGFEIVNNPYGRKLVADEVVNLALNCVGIIAGLEPLDEHVLSKLPELRCISRVGAGMDNIDIDFARQRGIDIRNTPDGPTQAVAEMTLGLTMSLLRKISIADANIKKGIWQKEIGSLLLGKKVSVIGLGRIGRQVAGIFISLGNTILAYDINPDTEWAQKMGIQLVDFETALAEGDIITLHVPGKEDGSSIIASEELSLIKESSFIVNAARGSVIDESALHTALTNGKLAGAAVDVFAKEPYTGPLINLDNVTLTPHIGSYAKEGKLKMEVDAVTNMLTMLGVENAR